MMWIKLLSLLFLMAFSADAALYDSEGSAIAIQHRINAAADGAVIRIPAGSFTWAQGVTIAGKGITLQGAGQGATSIKNVSGHPLISVSSVSSSGTRITGLTLLGDHAVAISGSRIAAPYRADHCTFDDGTTHGAVLVEVGGNGPGLIDQCQFIAGSASEMIHNYGLGQDNPSAWRDDVFPGSEAALYIEDCTFSKNPLADKYFWGTSAVQSYFGSRTVMRNCVLNACQIDQHGTEGMIGARWFEFYNNTFYTPPGMYQSTYFDLRGGSGVVFNNVNTGQNLQGGGIAIRDENGGTLPLYLGRGIGQKYSPVYLWNNGPAMPVISGSSNVVAGRDFFVSSTQPSKLVRYERASDNSATTYSYSPFPYPHPLRNAAVHRREAGSSSR
jgi:hypothetical protein